MEFNQEYLKKFLIEGTLTKDNQLRYYQGEVVKDKYRLIGKDIEKTFSAYVVSQPIRF